jgi:nitroreductase
MQLATHLKQMLSLLAAALVGSTLLAQDIPLPSPQTSGGLPLMDALAKRSTAREFASKELSPGQLSGLLWACFGINRPDGKRTAPSAQNCQETDIYVILPQGAYLYKAKSNQLSQVVKDDLRSLASTQAFATNAPVTLVFVADFARMGKWSAEEKKEFADMDVGYISQNAYLYCASEGLVTGARASVDRKILGPKLKLRPDQRIVLAQSVGYPKP